MSTTLTGKNQITIPAAIVREMKLEPGTLFEWRVGDKPGEIVLTVQPTIRERLAEIQRWGKVVKEQMGPSWDPVAELIAERELDMKLEEQEEAENNQSIEQRKTAEIMKDGRAQ